MAGDQADGWPWPLLTGGASPSRPRVGQPVALVHATSVTSRQAPSACATTFELIELRPVREIEQPIDLRQMGAKTPGQFGLSDALLAHLVIAL